MAGTRGKNRHQDHGHDEEHEEHVNHEAWVIPYADMLTLLMALFLVLFAIGRTDTEKFKALAESFREAFGSTSSSPIVFAGGADGPMNGGPSVLEHPGAHPDGALSPAEQALADQESEHNEARAERNTLTDVEEALATEAERLGLLEDLEFDLEARGLVITVVSDQVLFSSGRADIQPDGLTLLALVAEALDAVPNQVLIEGHTDSRPISNDRYRSNWELSTARATSVLQFLLGTGMIEPQRLAASGYAETRPIDTNDTDEGAARNRRVEIVVLADVPLGDILDEAPSASGGGTGADPDVVPDLAPVIVGDPGTAAG